MNILLLFFALVQHAAMQSINDLLVLIEHCPIVDKNDGIPYSRNRKLEYSSRKKMHIEIVGRSSGVDRANLALPLARNDLHFHLFSLVDLDFIAGVLLVGWRNHLVLALQVDPQLEAQAVLIEGGWHFRVQDSSASSHPLQISGADLALVSFEVLVKEVALLHVGDSFEAPVRVVWEAGRQPNFEVVKHEEGIEVSEILVADNANDLGSFALVDPAWFEDQRHAINKKIEEEDPPLHLYQFF